MDDSKLIELVRRRPCIFNPKHCQYKDSNVRENVWAEIAGEMELPAEECKNRWKNIRDTYMRRKRGKRLPKGSASSKRLRKWHLENQLVFLNMVECEKETVTNTTKVVGTQATEDDEVHLPQNVDLEEEMCDSYSLNTKKFDQELPEYEDDSDKKPSNKRKPNTNLSGENLMKVFKKKADDGDKQHPMDVFFQSMALTVKNFSPENQIRARLQVCQIVSELELEDLQQSQNTSPQ